MTVQSVSGFALQCSRHVAVGPYHRSVHQCGGLSADNAITVQPGKTLKPRAFHPLAGNNAVC